MPLPAFQRTFAAWQRNPPVKPKNQKAAALSRTPPRASSLLDTRVINCGDNLEQLAKLPDACVDLIYIDPPFNSNRHYGPCRTVHHWGETKEKRAFEDAANPPAPILTTCTRAACNWPASSRRPAAFIGAKVVRHSRKIIFQMAEAVVPRELFRVILEEINRLRLATVTRE